MDIVTTSLEALIQRATSNRNQCPDTAAIDAFCGLINREPECAQMAAKFITAKVHSLQEWEALQALHLYSEAIFTGSVAASSTKTRVAKRSLTMPQQSQ